MLYHKFNATANDKKRKFEDELYFGMNFEETDPIVIKKPCHQEFEILNKVSPLEFSFGDLKCFDEETDISTFDLQDNNLFSDIFSPDSSPSFFEKEESHHSTTFSTIDPFLALDNFCTQQQQDGDLFSPILNKYIPLQQSPSLVPPLLTKQFNSTNDLFNGIKLLASTPPKDPFEEKILVESAHRVICKDCLVCYYCGHIFKKTEKLKDIQSHMKECCKKKGKLLIPVFQFKNSNGEIKNAFLKDSFEIGLEDKLFKKLKNKFKIKLKSKVLSMLEPKHRLFSKLPKTFKNPSNNKVIVYEFDRFVCNFTDELLFGTSYSFVDTHLLID